MIEKSHDLLAMSPEYRSSRYFPATSLQVRPCPSATDVNTDEVITLSVKQMDRLIVLASATGARFERQDIDGDPIEWMYTPLCMFDGHPAVEACRNREAFLDAMRLHSAGLRIDTSPKQARPPGAIRAKSRPEEREIAYKPQDLPRKVQMDAPTPRFLFTTTIVDYDGEATLHVYHAMMARNIGDVKRLLGARYGLRLSSLARTSQGFDPSEPLAVALLSDALSDTLELIAVDPSSPLGDGLDIQLEARFIG